ncbi:hypothetical protein ANTRET_LOCUS1062 [Anthophora retusa]
MTEKPINVTSVIGKTVPTTTTIEERYQRSLLESHRWSTGPFLQPENPSKSSLTMFVIGDVRPREKLRDFSGTGDGTCRYPLPCARTRTLLEPFA